MSQLHCELHYRCLVIITMREILIRRILMGGGRGNLINPIRKFLMRRLLREEGGGNLIIPMQTFLMRRTMKPRKLEEREDLLTRLTLLLTSQFWFLINLFPIKNFGSCGLEYSREHHHIVEPGRTLSVTFGRGVFLLSFYFILCDGFLYDLFCVSFVTNLFKKSCLFQKKKQLQDERREQHV